MLAVDWSYTKGLAVYDGKKVRVLDRKALLRRLAEDSMKKVKSILGFNSAGLEVGEESKQGVKSKICFNSPTPLITLEQGAPLSLIYDILKTGWQVGLISNRATQDYRMEHDIEKSDETDAKIIYELATNGAKLTPVSLDDKDIQLLELYQRYKRYQKARVAMMNMKGAYLRQFAGKVKSTLPVQSIVSLNNPSPVPIGGGESTSFVKSSLYVQPPQANEGEGESNLTIKSTSAFYPSPFDGTLPYDIAIDTLKAAEDSCLKKIIKLAPPVPQSVKIKGMGPRIWAGIFITANPAIFPTLSRYLRYCGLVDQKQLGTKWSRHARMLYHMLADEVMKQRDEKFRPIYDKCKEDIASRYPDYTPKHTHNAALNRTATFLAKEIYYGVRRNGN